MLETKDRETLVNIRISSKLGKKIVKNDYLYTQEIVDNVKKILGLDFYGISKFVEREIFQFSENKCTILVTRRCLLLVDWFIGYLINKNYEKSGDSEIVYEKDDLFPFVCVNDKKNYIISDKADISLLRDKIVEVKILDDICIHGISLNKTAERIAEIVGDNIQIETSVYMYSKETIRVTPEKFNKVSLRANWKDLSMRIIDFINYLNLPYVSYLNSLTIPNFSEDKFNKLIIDLLKMEGFVCEEFDKENNRIGKFSYFFIEKNCSLSDFELMKCIRIYYNRNIKTICFMPYVILKSIENFDKNDICNLISNYIDLNSKIKKEIENKNLDYIYSFITFIASQSYWLKICDKLERFKIINNSKSGVQDNIGCLEKFFGYNLINLVNKTNFNIKIIETNDNRNFDTKLFREFSKFEAKAIDKVCIKSWLDFEESSEQNRARQEDTGYIVLEDLLHEIYNDSTTEEIEKRVQKDIGKNNIEFNLACFINILSYCDQGKLNITCTPERGVSLLKAGELGCLCVNRIIFDNKYREYMRSLLNYSYYRNLFI